MATPWVESLAMPRRVMESDIHIADGKC
jgi:hypothetical protein